RLFGGSHRIPNLTADRHDVVADDVAGQHELRGHFIELHQLACDQRIVLTINGTRLQRGIHLSVCNGNWICANRFAEKLPELARRHPQFDSCHVRGGPDLTVGLQIDIARSEVDGRDDLDANLVPRHLYELPSDV